MIKEKGTTHWDEPNYSTTNTTGFTALPGVRRNKNGSFVCSGYWGNWWSATKDNTNGVWGREMKCGSSGVHRTYNFKQSGFSFRCVKD